MFLRLFAVLNFPRKIVLPVFAPTGDDVGRRLVEAGKPGRQAGVDA